MDRRHLLLGLCGLVLAGCGRKGKLEPPEDYDRAYPRHYPVSPTTKPAEPASSEESAPPADPTTPMWRR